MGMSFIEPPATDNIDFFIDRYHFLSNFHLCTVIYEGITYPSSEHAFQAAKSTDPEVRKKVATCGSANASKQLGKQLKIRPNWDDIKYPIMKNIVRNKFTQNEDLKKRLLATGDVKLTEGNTWHDCYWGKCQCAYCGGEGYNALGQILMEIRDELRNLDS